MKRARESTLVAQSLLRARRYSPVFFGYATKTVKAVNAEAKAEEVRREREEEEVVRRLLQQRREEIELLREEQGVRRKGRAARVLKLADDQAKAAAARGAEVGQPFLPHALHTSTEGVCGVCGVCDVCDVCDVCGVCDV